MAVVAVSLRLLLSSCVVIRFRKCCRTVCGLSFFPNDGKLSSSGSLDGGPWAELPSVCTRLGEAAPVLLKASGWFAASALTGADWRWSGAVLFGAGATAFGGVTIIAVLPRYTAIASYIGVPLALDHTIKLSSFIFLIIIIYYRRAR